MVTFEEINVLQKLLESNTMDSDLIVKQLIMTKKKRVQEVHKGTIYVRKEGRYATFVKSAGGNKQITGKTETELYTRLYDYYFGKEMSSMEGLFSEWIRWRKEETPVTDKTIRENTFLWNAMLRDTEIVKIPLKNLAPKDFIKFFRILTKERTVTRKKFNDMKSILNGILYYAVEQEIIQHNYLRDINYRQFAYKPENTGPIPYNEEEREMIIENIGDDILSLAIKLDFYLPLRIGELKGLRYSDVQGDYLYIQRFINDKYEVVEHIKGNTTEGKRYIPLTAKAKCIIEQVKEMNPDSQYIFFTDGKAFPTCTFNRRIKKCCEKLGIVYRSSHQVRFSTASILNKNGIEATEIQKMLGHTSLTMTNHYLRSITPREETGSKMQEILDFSRAAKNCKDLINEKCL